jgi:hypothetical protein
VIDVACPVSSAGTVNCPSGVDLEQVSIVDLVRDFRRKLPAAISDDELPLLDRYDREKAKPGFRSADPKVTRR